MSTSLATQGFDSGMTSGSNAIQVRTALLAETVAEDILRSVEDRMQGRLTPSATYRLQLHKDFTFNDAANIIPYLNALGISHIYTSPYLKARKNSPHGYDVVDPTTLNPELGTEADFSQFVQKLRDLGMGHILDFVPNHMGVGGDDNPWWQDVLENGPSSPYATFFDIDWHPLKPDLTNKVLLPVLGEQYGTALENGQLVLRFDAGAFFLTYFERRFPIAPRSAAIVLKYRIEELTERLGADHTSYQEYQSILTAIKNLPLRVETAPEQVQERHREKEVIKRRLHRLCEESAAIARFIDENIAFYNGRAGDPDSFDLLDGLLQDQVYRLSSWQVAADEINYRRFFDVNELAALCMENSNVFNATHHRVLQLFEEERLDGLRIDHADGLYAPTDYLWALQEVRFLQMCRQEYGRLLASRCSLLSESTAQPDWEVVEPILLERFGRSRRDGTRRATYPLYLIVEKILEGNESLPTDWPVEGTSGYEFLNRVNQLFVAPWGEKPMESFYARFIADAKDFDELVYHSKRLIMKVSMAGELNMLAHQLDRISEQNRRSRDFTLNGLTHALREIVACFPVYRTYTTHAGVLDRDRQYIEHAVAEGKRRNPAVSHAVFDFVRDLLLLEVPAMALPTTTETSATANQLTRCGAYCRDSIMRFIGRFQQFTAPMMAKAVEDTAYYNYHRLISLNEVGGDPRQFGESVETFHEFNSRRLQSYPQSLSATATHDTKRGEDTRMRINVLTQLSQTWKDHVQRWARWNKRKKTLVDGELAPSRNDEYLLYQTLIGTWPFEPLQGDSLRRYVERVQCYMTKALREAKRHSSWIAPNEDYERATHEFITAIVADESALTFRADFEPFTRKIAASGIWESLSQMLLKLTCPGVPDVYQGAELWDFSLVDPDNRQPVNYAIRREYLRELRCQFADPAAHSRLAADLVAQPFDGRIKLFVMHIALLLRRQNQELFAAGEYVPLELRGERSEHLCAFARVRGEHFSLTIAPRLTARLRCEPGLPPLGEEAWRDTCLVLPELPHCDFLRNALTGESHLIGPGGGTLEVRHLLKNFPLGLYSNFPFRFCGLDECPDSGAAILSNELLKSFS